MRFLIFSDLHHMPGVFMGGTEEDLRFFQNRAQKTGCDFIIHAGDLAHGDLAVKQPFVDVYHDSPIPAYHIMGNHDTDETTLKDTLRLYNMPAPYYFFDQDGYRIICLNTSYLKDGDKYIHYELQNYYGNRDNRDYVPPEELKWLEKIIAASPHPCVLISHASLERAPDGVRNQHAVRSIIDRANKRKKHSVLLCINGHYHCDHLRILNDVCYLDLNSASYDWLPNPHYHYPEELCGKISLLSNTLVYNDPLCAVITLEGCTIHIDGMDSTYLCGIDRSMTPNTPWDEGGREMTPCIRSAHITL